MLLAAGFAPVYSSRVADVVGHGLVIAVLALQCLRRDTAPSASP
jgi:hypothetical protein